MKQTTRLACAGLAVGVIFAGIGAALGGVKSVGFNHGFQIVATKQRTLPLRKVNQLTINSLDSDVTVKSGQQAQIKLVDRQVNKIHVTQANGQVTIDSTRAQQNWFGFDLEADTPKIIVTVPAKNVHQVQITNHSGAITLQRLQIKQLTLENESAATNLTNVHSSNGDITSHSGAIQVNASQFKKTQLRTTSGQLSLQNSRLAQSQLSSQSGAQKLSQSTLINSTSTSQSGAITLQQPKLAQGLTLKAASGAISVQQAELTPTGYHILTGSGKIRLHQQTYQHEFTRNPNSANVLTVQTASGSVNIN